MWHRRLLSGLQGSWARLSPALKGAMGVGLFIPPCVLATRATDANDSDSSHSSADKQDQSQGLNPQQPNPTCNLVRAFWSAALSHEKARHCARPAERAEAGDLRTFVATAASPSPSSDHTAHDKGGYAADPARLIHTALSVDFVPATARTSSGERIQTHTYDHPWELVVYAHMLRYPLHERVPVMLESRLLHSVEEDNRLVQVRWLRLAAEAPRWLQKAFGTAEFEFLQKIEVDYDQRFFCMRGKNLTYANLVTCEEVTVFKANENDPMKTDFVQTSWLELPHFPFSSYVAKYIVSSYDGNTSKGRAIDVLFIAETLQDGSFDRHGRFTNRPGPTSA